MANRILAAAQEYAARLAGKPAEVIARMEEATTLEAGEGAAYQRWQSQAHAAGILSLDEANTIFRALDGERAEWAASTALALKLAITQTMKEIGAVLMKAKAGL